MKLRPMTKEAKEHMNKVDKFEKREDCYCSPQGMCFPCFKLEMRAWEKGYKDAFKDLFQFLKGKKTPSRFKVDWEKKLKEAIKSYETLTG